MSKKQGTETLDKLVKGAIVPKNEQPYEIPGNWIWIRLGNNYAICLDKFRKPINAKERAEREGDIPYYGATGQVGWIDDFLTNEELVILGEDGAPFLNPFKNKAYMISGKAWVNNHAHILKSNFGSVGNEFLLYYLNQFDFSDYVSGTTRLKLTQKQMNNIPIPLPPLSEQQRITEKIKGLLNKIADAEQLIEEVKISFDIRRASILENAFQGDFGKGFLGYGEDTLLSRAQKETPYEIPENWQWTKLGEIANFINGDRGKNYPNKAEFLEEGIPFINTGHLKDGLVDFTNMLYISEEKYTQLRSGKVNNHDVLYCLRGNTLGKTGIVKGIDKGAIASSLVIMRPNDKIDSKFLYYYLISPLGRVMIKLHDNGSAQPNLSVKNVKEFIIPLPSIDEQKIIVEKLESLLNNMLEENNLAKSAETQLKILKQSILSKVFRGKLGTNEPNEENAIELLKQVLQEQIK